MPTTLVVKASFGNSLTRRVTFSNVDTVYFEQFKQKLAHCFSLDVSSFRIAYQDDDGDQTELATGDDLVEAIAYFNDDPEAAGATGSGGSAYSGAGSLDGRARGKITMRVFCLIDSTLSLSDAGSILGSEASGSEWGDNSAHQPHSSEYSSSSASTDNRPRIPSHARPQSVWDERSQTSSPRPPNQHYTSYPGSNGSRAAPARLEYRNTGHAGSYPGASSARYGPNVPLLPPPPRPPLPPPPPSSYRPSPSSPPDPYEYDDARTESDYAAPPGRSPEFSRPTPPREPSNGHGPHALGVIKPKAGVGTLFRAPSSGSSSSSSRSSVGRAGRRFRGRASVYGGSSVGTTPEGEEEEEEEEERSARGEMPLSAPPTYKSGSGKSEVGEDLQQRWLRAQRVNVKGKARAYSISDTESAYSGNGRAAGPSHDRHYSHPHQHASTSQHAHSGPTEFDLPTLLHDLSLSRMPPPSVLSSVPDAMLACSACKRRMEDFRYICCQCGPRQLEQALSDDGTQVNIGDGAEADDDGGSVDGTVISFGTESVEETDGLLGRQSPVDPARAGLPASPATSPSTSANGSDQSRDATDPLGVLSQANFEGQTRPTTETEPAEQDDDSAWSGYELCSECVEKEGPRHAAAMAKVAAEQPLAEGELPEVRHSFAEVMKTHDFGGEWREVDYDNDVECSICGDGPLQTSRFKCLSCSRLELCLNCWRSVDEIHPAHAFLSVPDRPARPPADLLEDVRPTVNGQPTVEDLRLAFLRARGLVGSNGERVQDPSYSNSAASLTSRAAALQSVEHPQFCFGCLQNIRGPRYSCSVCLAFDICQVCEAKTDPPITSPDGRHEPSHIMLKILVPVSEAEVEDASERARLVSRGSGSSLYHRDRSPPGRRGDRGRTIEFDRQSRDWDQPRWRHDPRNGVYAPPPPPNWAVLPPPPHYGGPQHFAPPWEHPRPTYVNQDVLRHVVHQVACRRCRRAIQGIRWLCAQCPTTPATYDLCSECEKQSHACHNPLHCFLRITTPIYKPLPPLGQLLPVLYDPASPLPHDDGPDGPAHPASADGRAHSGLGDALVLHPNVICDICLEAIAGGWMRCANCASSFDVCAGCIEAVEHDPKHVFVKFKRRVDMALFRGLVRLNTSPVPLIGFGLLD